MKYFLILILFLLVSCRNQDSMSKNDLELNFFDNELSWHMNKPILKIYFESNECGEWGGHEEYLIVSGKSKHKYKLEYERYGVNCDSMVLVSYKEGELYKPLNTLTDYKEIELGENEKKAILNFSLDILKSKFNEEEVLSNAEIKMSINNSDSTLFIWKYGGNADIYYQLLKSLKIN